MTCVHYVYSKVCVIDATHRYYITKTKYASGLFSQLVVFKTRRYTPITPNTWLNIDDRELCCGVPLSWHLVESFVYMLLHILRFICTSHSIVDELYFWWLSPLTLHTCVNANWADKLTIHYSPLRLFLFLFGNSLISWYNKK